MKTRIVNKHIAELYETIADVIIEKTSSDNFSVALSGGSTPNAFYRFLADYDEFKNISSRLHFYWGDERCVAADSDESNFKQASEALLQNLSIGNEQIMRIEGEAEPQREADRYRDVLCDQLVMTNDLPVFDFILLGLGTDGHTASVFPDTEPVYTNGICAVYSHPETGQKRISITEAVINSAKNVAFLVTGEKKKEIVKKILGDKPDMRLPASRIKPVAGELLWFLDSEAYNSKV